jgi:uncharacterized protein (DUF305 family)
MYRRVRLRHVIVFVGVLSGCASIDPFADSSSPTSAPTRAVSNSFNAADVTFLNAMLFHERVGLALAGRTLEPTSTVGADVTTIAGHLVDEAQGRIETMSEWLNEWNHFDSTDSATMSSVSPGPDALGGLSGADFEQLWVELMIEHHTVGVGLAEEVQRDGVSRDVNKFVSGMLVDLGFEVSRLEDVAQR